jgi:DNA-binding NtrC family response regulator
MAYLSRAERHEAEAFARIGYSNPFLTERLDLERQILGERFQSGGAVIHFPSDPYLPAVFQNFSLLMERCRALADKMRQGVVSGKMVQEEDQRLYRETVLVLLYGMHFSVNEVPLIRRTRERAEELGLSWAPFKKDYDWYLRLPNLDLPSHFDSSHCFSIFYQIDRAFSHIFDFIIGSSMPVANLRATVWESIFTHDMGRYIRGVYKSIGDITTLVTGKSGTGKELVAQAIGLSRYQAFNPKTKKFDEADRSRFFPLNLSALSSTLIESELFGHCKGSFTGAVNSRKGWFEECGQNGTVFLDEIGEIEQSIQVKLLRVLQTRTFSPVGETKPRRFLGKFVAATNRDLAHEIDQGKFREDLYYRLCADIVRTPTLQEQLQDRPEDLYELSRFISRRLLADMPDEADCLASEAMQWIDRHFGNSYAWPGNIRELEQCVRNVLIRKTYTPSSPVRPRKSGEPAIGPVGSTDEFVRALLAGEMTLQKVAARYTCLVYSQAGRYDLASQKLGIDWRTVRDKVKKSLFTKPKSGLS